MASDSERANQRLTGSLAMMLGLGGASEPDLGTPREITIQDLRTDHLRHPLAVAGAARIDAADVEERAAHEALLERCRRRAEVACCQDDAAPRHDPLRRSAIA